MKTFFLFLTVFALNACSAQKGQVGDGDGDILESDTDAGNEDEPAPTTDSDTDEGSDDNDTGSDDTTDDMELVFTLDADASTAGESLGFEIHWKHDADAQTPVETFSISSDLEEAFIDSVDNNIVLTRAGTHTIVVTAEDNTGEEQTVSDTVDVNAGVTVVLDLIMTAETVLAGESVEGLLTAEDAFGNEVPTEEAAWLTPELVDQDGTVFVSTATGDYTVKAELDSLSAEATWSVIAGPPAMIDLELSSTALDAGDDTTYSISVVDGYGNEVDTETDLSVSEGAIIEGDTIVFESEGIFICNASVPETDLSDTETVIVDDSSPELIVVNPERADWTTSGTITVEGTASDSLSGLSMLTVSGEAVDVEEDGTFVHEKSVSYGINIIETVAIDDDPDSHENRDVRSVLQVGDWISPAFYREEALLVRINEGPGGLEQLGDLADTIMDSVDLDALLSGDLYSMSGGFWPFDYDITMTATSVDYEDASITVDAVSGGTLNIRLTISDLFMEFVVSGDAPFVSLPADGSVNIDAMYVDISIRPTIEDGGLSFDDATVTVPDPDGLTVYIGSGLGDLASFIGIDIDGLVVEEMRSAVGDAVSGETDGLLDGILGDFTIEETFDVSGMTYTLLAQIGTIEVDDNGMVMGFETRVIPDEILSSGAIEGIENIPVFDWWTPDLAADDSGFQMALSPDVLNQMMFAMWQGGMLDQELTSEDLGIDPALLSLVFADADELTILTTPHLPPVFTPREETEAGEVYDLTIGSLAVDVFDGSPESSEPIMNLFIATTVPVALSVSEENINITLGEATVYADMTHASPDLSVSPDTIEPLFGGVLAEYIPEITGDLSSIPLPSLDGFSIDIESTRMSGGDSPPAFWIAEGSLE